MQTNSLRKKFENIEMLHFTGWGCSVRTSGCEFSVFAPVSKGCLAPSNRRMERAFGTIVGRLNPRIHYEGKHALSLSEEQASQYAHFTLGAVHMISRQPKEFPHPWDRFLDELVAIEIPFAKSMPEPKQSRMQHPGIAGEASGDRSSGELLYSNTLSKLALRT